MNRGRYPQQVRERAVQMVLDHADQVRIAVGRDRVDLSEVRDVK